MRTLPVFSLALALLPALGTRAQFQGGTADGVDRTTVVQISLDGIPRGVRALYVGGRGDGFDAGAVASALGGQKLTVLYRGGRNDGYDAANKSTTLTGEVLAVLFGGGRGDGFDEARGGGFCLGGRTLTVLYGGGLGDGFDAHSVALTLNGDDLAVLFRGGTGDGFDVQSGMLSLGGARLAAVYGGGPGDGFDKLAGSFALGGTDLAQLFGGGIGDGFDVATLSGATPLPLTLLLLEAIVEGPINVVRWTTADERNTEFFLVERAGEDASTTAFTELGEVPTRGNELAPGLTTDYGFTDGEPPLGTSYYRLQLHDLDGEVTLSQVVSVTRAMATNLAPSWDYTLYPNPNSGHELYVLPKGLPAVEVLAIEIIDATGRVVHHTQKPFDGSSEIRLGLIASLSAGSYLVRVSSGDTQQNKVLIVSRSDR